jgi:hypothetical protein
MDILTTSLFSSSKLRKITAGYHNLGSGLQRASRADLVKGVEALYGQRCGHLPLEAQRVHVLVAEPTPEIERHMAYLSQLMGKTITALSLQDFAGILRQNADANALVVPYINVSETEHVIEHELKASSWGLAGKMVDRLKNKADFYCLLDDLHLPGLEVPDYTIASLEALPQAAFCLLRDIEELLSRTDMACYPVGLMLRGAEADGQNGSCLVRQSQHRVLFVPDGHVQLARSYLTWQQALKAAQEHLASSMDPEKENRVVISRLLDVADSPGLSVVIMNGQVVSLGWNAQLQEPWSTACVGTSPYQPKNAMMARVQQEAEAQTAVLFETLLRETAQRCGLDFASLRGVANLDLMLPGPQEQMLQQKRGRSPALYLAECNPRWTNYTDALLTVVAVKREAPSINALQTVIQQGMAAVDYYPLPSSIEPERVRDELLRHHETLSQAGISIICRMTRNPMGFIFAGPVEQARQALAQGLESLTTTTTWAGACDERLLVRKEKVSEE